MATTTYYMSAISLIVQYLTNLGLLAGGGQVNTYVAGSVNTPVNTYTDSTGLSVNPNPLTLNSAARPALPGGAPTAFWAPAGTSVKLVVYDAAGNLLVQLDNIPSLNDITNSTNALQTLLASGASSNQAGTGPVAGADLVANAVKSYDIFADVRSANVPTLVTGQTLNIEVQGGTAVADGLGGFFYWAPTSTATDDSRTVLKPNGLVSSAAGRWLRYYPLGMPLILCKTQDQAVSSSTSLVADTALTIASLPVGTWLIQKRLLLAGSGGTGQGYKVETAFAGSISQALTGGGVATANGTAGAVADIINASNTAAAISTTGDCFNSDTVAVVTAPGQLQVQFAQNTSNANSTVMKAGSALILTRLA